MNNLKRLRTEKGLTQAQLAESVGTTQRMIQKYESGERDIQKVQVQTVLKMAQALGCSMEDIISNSEDIETDKIYLIYNDSQDDCATIIGYIKGTENDAGRYVEEYNKKCERYWQEVWLEELECLNKGRE